MHKTALALALATTCLSAAPSMAQSKYIGGAHVTVLPAPTCGIDGRMPWPSDTTHYGQPGHPLVVIGKSTMTVNGVTATDPYQGLSGLAGQHTYLALVGQTGFSSAATYTFGVTHTPSGDVPNTLEAFSLLLGSPDHFGHISGWNGATEVFEVSGAELQARLAGGVQQMNLMFQFRPITTLIFGSHGPVTEIANFVEGDGPECPPAQ